MASIEEEAVVNFSEGKVFPCVVNLREELRAFAHKKGFSVATQGVKLNCSLGDLPSSHKSKKAKTTPSVPGKATWNRTTNRC